MEEEKEDLDLYDDDVLEELAEDQDVDDEGDNDDAVVYLPKPQEGASNSIKFTLPLGDEEEEVEVDPSEVPDLLREYAQLKEVNREIEQFWERDAKPLYDFGKTVQSLTSSDEVLKYIITQRAAGHSTRDIIANVVKYFESSEGQEVSTDNEYDEEALADAFSNRESFEAVRKVSAAEASKYAKQLEQLKAESERERQERAAERNREANVSTLNAIITESKMRPDKVAERYGKQILDKANELYGINDIQERSLTKTQWGVVVREVLGDKIPRQQQSGGARRTPPAVAPARVRTHSRRDDGYGGAVSDIREARRRALDSL
jgi:hypothetical protein